MQPRLLVGSLLAFLTLAVYWQTQHHEFINFDDDVYVTDNPHVRTGFSSENLVWAFTTTRSGNWIPLCWLSLMLDAQLYGNESSGFHLTNVLLHTANSLLLFGLLLQMTGALWSSAFVAALFAVHPLHVESVAWVTERKDVLSTFFGFCAIGAYIRHARRPSKTWLLISLAFFTCSLLSKPMLVTLPFVLILLDYWPLRRMAWMGVGWHAQSGAMGVDAVVTPFEDSGRATRPDGRLSFSAYPLRQLLVEKLPFLALTVLFCLIAFFSQRSAGGIRSLEFVPFGVRCCNAVVVYVLYLWKTALPYDLSVFYPHPGDAVPPAGVAGAGLLLLLMTAGAIRQARRRPYLAVGWFWYLGTLLPVIGLVQIGGQQMADRYTYVPLIGPFIAVTWLAPTLVPAGRGRRCFLPALAAVILIALATVAWRQTSRWRNTVVLFEHALASTKNNGLAHGNLGSALAHLHRWDQATYHLRRAVDLSPDNAKAHINLGDVLARKDRLSEADWHFREARRLRPDLADRIYDVRGAALASLGRFDEAIRLFRKAVAFNPDNSEARVDLAGVLFRQQKLDEAIGHLREALRLNPHSTKAHFVLGLALYRQNDLDGAQKHLRRAIELEPKHPDAHNSLGLIYLAHGKRDLAVKEFREALRLDPDFTQAQANLRRALDE